MSTRARKGTKRIRRTAAPAPKFSPTASRDPDRKKRRAAERLAAALPEPEPVPDGDFLDPLR